MAAAGLALTTAAGLLAVAAVSAPAARADLPVGDQTTAPPDPTPTDPTSTGPASADPASADPTSGDPSGGTTSSTPASSTAATSTPTSAPTSAPTATSPIPTPTGPDVDQLIAGAAPGTALAVLGRLRVRGRAPDTGYDRDRFGPRWWDADRNGCDTRNDILRRDLHPRRIKPGTGGCVVVSGIRLDPYTAERLLFLRGGRAVVDVDHVVSLRDAWRTGAPRWTPRRRAVFANDPLNLLAVSARANRAKADANAASWLPPNRRYRCAFVARQIAVKAKFGLSVTPAERQAMGRVLARCPAIRPPRGGLPLGGVAGPRSAPRPRPAPPPTTPRPRPNPGSGGGSGSGSVSGQTVSFTVHPGAFCSQHGWYGRTASGTRMRCWTSATDTRFRWRRV